MNIKIVKFNTANKNHIQIILMWSHSVHLDAVPENNLGIEIKFLM